MWKQQINKLIRMLVYNFLFLTPYLGKKGTFLTKYWGLLTTNSGVRVDKTSLSKS